MSDRLPGTSYDNPIWYRGYRIHLGPGYTRDSQWQFVHDDYDGAPNNPGDGPADHRAGLCETEQDCRNEIDELEDEA